MPALSAHSRRALLAASSAALLAAPAAKAKKKGKGNGKKKPPPLAIVTIIETRLIDNAAQTFKVEFKAAWYFVATDEGGIREAVVEVSHAMASTAFIRSVQTNTSEGLAIFGFDLPPDRIAVSHL